VAGVKDVANELQVASASAARPTDTELARAVRHALEWDALIPGREIRTTVTAGVVVLEGLVRTQIEREEAERLVARLNGVRRLDNRLQVSRVPQSDAVVAAIRQALGRRAVRETDHLTIKVTGGCVVVEGETQSREERAAILGAIRGTRGVQSIDDRLSVEPDGRGEELGR
jgi:osmotically-inducible protein OsmY